MPESAPIVGLAHTAPPRLSSDAEEITLRSAPQWIRRTIAQDRKLSPRTGAPARPLTPARVVASLDPRLDRPIFIVGAPRSGTTFLGECIAALPGVSYHFEPVATKAASRYVYEGRWSFGRSRAVFGSVYRLLLLLRGNAGLRFAEKTPQNCFVMPFLARAFPGASFVHIIRDGRDAALSYSRKPWLRAASADGQSREAGGYRNGPYARYWVEPSRRAEFESTSDFHRCIWAWRLHTESALHAAAALPRGTYHELRYEDLARRPMQEAERLLEFLGVRAADGASRFQQAVRGASSRSIGAWREALGPTELQEAETEAGALLRRLGYV